MQEAEPIGTDTDGQVTSVQTPDGQKNYNVTGKVVELADLKQAQGNYSHEIDRRRKVQHWRYKELEQCLTPSGCWNDPTSGSGRRLLRYDHVWKRTSAYNARGVCQSTKSLEAYQAALKEAGINTEGFSQPVFVRQLNDDMTIDQLKEFADLSNTEAQTQMTSTETAQRDAKRMPQNLITYILVGI